RRSGDELECFFLERLILGAGRTCEIGSPQVDGFDKSLPGCDALFRYVVGRIEVSDTEAGRRRIVRNRADHHGRVGGAQKPGALIGSLVADDWDQANVGGDAARGRAQLAEHRAVVRPVARRLGFANQAHGNCLVMNLLAVSHRANDCVTVSQLREPGYQFADAKTWYRSGDRPVRPARVVRRRRFGVPAINLAEATLLKNKDARPFGTALAGGSIRRTGLQQRGQVEESSDGAHLKKLPA